MIIKNDSSKFEIMLDGKDYTINNGLNEFENSIGNYILKTGSEFGYKLSIIDSIGKAPDVHEPDERFIAEPVQEVVNPIGAKKASKKNIFNKHKKK